jgi:hypothetical protein
MVTRYTDIDDFTTNLVPWMQPVFQEVRMLLLTFPEITEKLRYNNTPFYDCGGRRMAYLSPFERKRFVLGFCYGHLLPDAAGVLRNEKQQTHIRHWEFLENESINHALLIQYIQEAIHLNLQQHANPSTPRKRN